MTVTAQPDAEFMRRRARGVGRVAVGRYLETARHLRPMQALYWIVRRSVGRSYRVSSAAAPQPRPGIALREPIAASSCRRSGNSFVFLNTPHDFTDRVDWQVATRSKLWRYNLHYFDYALDPSRDPDWIAATMQDWIARNPPSRSTGWEPYPVSLRAVNWIKFALTRGRHAGMSSAWHDSLFRQLAWLERNLEHEIQANHLLKNAKALVFGGAYFSGAAADRWLRRGRRLLLREIDEQILPDGGHYERSVMYHAIVLEDLLDVLNLALSAEGLLADADIARLKRAARAALAFFDDMAHPDGSVPMFNDSVAGVAKDGAALSAYARALLAEPPNPPPASSRVIDKPATGYFGYRHGEELLLIDAGPVGPAHQPGHGHCDLLSFELIVGGRPLIVDSGTYDYENTPFRHALRGTAAHNTVRIDRREQSDIWGCFRVGRRARPFGVQHEARLPHRFRLTASHDGYRYLAGRPVHQRTFDCEPGHWWRVTDSIWGAGRHQVESYLHFHPDYRLRRVADDWIATHSSGIGRFRIRSTTAETDHEPSVYCPAFGVRADNPALRLSLTAELPVTFGYTIEVI